LIWIKAGSADPSNVSDGAALGTFMSKRTAICIGLAVALSIVLSAPTDASADPAAGKALADKWCAECHGIRAGRLSPNLAAPTFPELAAEPSITEYSLRALLRSPHETMPHITFTPDQMDDIVGYIMSLKPHN
jgi:mono/diheme cytochrome c family protein